MRTFLSSPADWAQDEFGLAQLGDKRRTERLIHVATNLAANPGGTLPQAFPDWAELKAAYRLLNQQHVTFERVIAPHCERSLQACSEPGEYLIIEDTTLLDFSLRPACEDLGLIGDGQGRGFELHSSLAVRIDAWNLEQRPEGTLMGLLHQQCCTPRPVPKGETRAQRLSRPRRSNKWAKSIRRVGRPPEGVRWILCADREADAYEGMDTCLQHGVEFVIRNCQDRRLAESPAHLRETVGQTPLLGRTTVEVRARGGQPARTAIVEVRSARVDLHGPWRPGGVLSPLKDIGVVEVREVNAPETVKEPLYWVLLTSLPCATWAEAQRVVGYYAARWWIEEYHKALKSGAGVEDSQLEKAYRLESLIAMLAVVAVRLLSTKMLARSRPESFEAASSFGKEMLSMLEHKIGEPKGGWTNKNVLVATARLGGFLARRHDGMPGWQTIWRGWHRLMWMCEGASLIHGQKRCG
jgi:hypothetical protein